MSSDMILGVAVAVFGLVVVGLAFTVSEFQRIEKDVSHDPKDGNAAGTGNQQSR